MSTSNVYAQIGALQKAINHLLSRDTLPSVNHGASAAPTTSDNLSLGYQTGSQWIYNGFLWVCKSSSTGTASWVPVAQTILLEKASSYSIAATDSSPGSHTIILCSNGSSATITLPPLASSSVYGRYAALVTARRVGTTLTLDGNGAETIEGAATLSVAAGEAVTLIASSTEWKTIARN